MDRLIRWLWYALAFVVGTVLVLALQLQAGEPHWQDQKSGATVSTGTFIMSLAVRPTGPEATDLELTGRYEVSFADATGGFAGSESGDLLSLVGTTAVRQRLLDLAVELRELASRR